MNDWPNSEDAQKPTKTDAANSMTGACHRALFRGLTRGFAGDEVRTRV